MIISIPDSFISNTIRTYTSLTVPLRSPVGGVIALPSYAIPLVTGSRFTTSSYGEEAVILTLTLRKTTVADTIVGLITKLTGIVRASAT